MCAKISSWEFLGISAYNLGNLITLSQLASYSIVVQSSASACVRKYVRTMHVRARIIS